eukprot:150323-Chlamydomonas_euryale.AAC.2
MPTAACGLLPSPRIPPAPRRPPPLLPRRYTCPHLEKLDHLQRAERRQLRMALLHPMHQQQAARHVLQRLKRVRSAQQLARAHLPQARLQQRGRGGEAWVQGGGKCGCRGKGSVDAAGQRGWVLVACCGVLKAQAINLAWAWLMVLLAMIVM